MFPFRDIDAMTSLRSFILVSAIAGTALAAAIFLSPNIALAATNINATTSQHFAWNDEIGWIDFYTTGNVNVTASQLQGYASSSAGPIALDCATSPSPSCAISYGVANDGNGDLSGWAWNDKIGWISFYWGDASSTYPVTGSTTAVCSSYGGYCGVQISPINGVFSGWAWNAVVGWISFNCSNTSCSSSNFDVVASWNATPATGMLDSQTFDTGVTSGAQLNSITWKGSTASCSPVCSVGFQIAVSNSSSGPWNFIGPLGAGSTYTCSGITGCTISPVNYTSLIGRYFRYRVVLTTNVAQTISPVVNDVIVNWSP
jgi:hypothetical protein